MVESDAARRESSPVSPASSSGRLAGWHGHDAVRESTSLPAGPECRNDAMGRQQSTADEAQLSAPGASPCRDPILGTCHRTAPGREPYRQVVVAETPAEVRRRLHPFRFPAAATSACCSQATPRPSRGTPTGRPISQTCTRQSALTRVDLVTGVNQLWPSRCPDPPRRRLRRLASRLFTTIIPLGLAA
jgi:hypothetical protein